MVVHAARWQVSLIFEAVEEQEVVLSVLIMFLSYIPSNELYMFK